MGSLILKSGDINVVGCRLVDASLEHINTALPIVVTGALQAKGSLFTILDVKNYFKKVSGSLVGGEREWSRWITRVRKVWLQSSGHRDSI